ncbi:MAG: hypothetical protein NTW87_09280 [Planctomycetota bacterium]|nr:hypothetical protein [Planctomycetota bacterium]
MARLFLKRQPSMLREGPFLMSFCRKLIEQKAESCPDFPEHLRRAALEALQDEDVGWVRSGLQALAVVGEPADMAAIAALTQHPDESVRVDVETCLCEVRRRKG